MVTVLITGANRGIGLRLAQAYAARGDRVVAAVRDPAKMPQLEGKVTTVKLDASDDKAPFKAVEELKAQGVDKLDYVIANAGINLSSDTFAKVSAAELRNTNEVNVIGVIMLYQAVRPLLDLKTSKFVVVSSIAGSSAALSFAGQDAYTISKAAVSYFTLKAHTEEPELVIFAVSPGWVETDMGSQGAAWNNMAKPPDDINKTVPGLVEVIDAASKQKYSGKLINWDGGEFPF